MGPEHRRRCSRLGGKLGRGIAEHLEQLGAAHTVDHAMVDLVEDRGTAVRESVDEVRFPQWAIGIERRGHQLVDQRVQLGVPAGRRDAHVTDVVARVEARHVLPAGQRPVEHGPDRPLGIARQLGEALNGQLDERAVGDGTIEERNAPDVESLHRALEVEERRVHCR